MRLILVSGLFWLCVGLQAPADEPAVSSEPVPDAQQQEAYVLLSAKVKKMSEIQDLLIQQQQLLLQHLADLRKAVDELRANRTNLPTRADLAGCVATLEQLDLEFRRAQETNAQFICGLIKAAMVAGRGPATGVSNSASLIKAEPYIVQPGDTLLKILARINEVLERAKLPEVTADQIIRANPGLNADRIRVGQTLIIPLPVAP